MKRVSVNRFLKLLEDRRGTSVVTLVSKTEPEMIKTHRETGEENPYLGRVERICKRAGILGASYEAAVNRQRLLEGKPEIEPGTVEYFSAEELWFGRGERDTNFTARHSISGDRYLVLFPRTKKEGEPVVLEDLFVDRETGTVLSKEELSPYLKLKSKPKKQGTDRPIRYRTIEVHNLEQVSMDGEIYVLTPGRS